MVTTGRKRDDVYVELLRRFVCGEYMFGEKILVSSITEETGVSRFPVMAALNQLQASGFVIITAQVGCQVVAPSAAEIHDFFLLFGRMEGMLAELAAERRLDVEVSSLRLINGRIRKISSGAEAGEEYRVLNQDLHRAIHQFARSPAQHTRQVANWAMADFLISQANGFEYRFKRAVREHELIIDAIEQKATQEARRIMEDHITSFGQSVVSLVQTGFPPRGGTHDDRRKSRSEGGRKSTTAGRRNR